jgi:hypothetical protein
MKSIAIDLIDIAITIAVLTLLCLIVWCVFEVFEVKPPDRQEVLPPATHEARFDFDSVKPKMGND